MASIASAFASVATFSSFVLKGRSKFSRKGWVAALEKETARRGLAFLGEVDLSGKVYIVTGANSGCGLEVCRYLYYRGAAVYMMCRSRDRALAAKQQIESESRFDKAKFQCNNADWEDTSRPGTLNVISDVDCSSGASVRSGWDNFLKHLADDARLDNVARLDGVVCNAGMLNPTSTPNFTEQGDGISMEETLATHLFYGSYLLAKLALPLLQKTVSSGNGLTQGRLVFVSSGGMLNCKFPDLETIPFIKKLNDDPASSKPSFSGNLQYAYAKRGQVLLAERLAVEAAQQDVLVTSCHPGWTNTPGVEKAYGSQKSMLEPLRSLWEGVAGSVVWCLVGPGSCGGDFYLDFEAQPKHIKTEGSWFASYTRNSMEEVDVMMATLEKYAKPFL